MHNKRWKDTFAGILFTALALCCNAGTADVFAYGGEEGSEDYSIEAGAWETEETVEEAVQEDTGEQNTDAADSDNTDENTDENESAEGGRDVAGALTPDGSLTLVDDLEGEESEDMQFMTVTTRDGSYYYIIIDRSGSKDNVYFLNAVDAADLMNLMSDEEKAEITGTEEKEETTITPTLIPDQEEEKTASDQKETEKAATENKTQTSSSAAILAVFAVIGIAIIAAYYFLKIRPGKGAGSIDEDREFYDDEEYIDEDEEEEDEEQNLLKEDAGETEETEEKQPDQREE